MARYINRDLLTQTPHTTYALSQRSWRMTERPLFEVLFKQLPASSSILGRLRGALPGGGDLPWRDFLR